MTKERRMHKHAAGIFALLSVAMLATAAPPPTTDEAEVAVMLGRIEAQNSARLERARALAASGEPRKLYAASLLSPLRMDLAGKQITPSPEAQTWLAQAIEKGSDDPLIAAAAVRGCIQNDECSIDTAVLTLQNAGADDAALQLLLMHLAEHRGDIAGAATAWQQAIAARYYGDALAQLVGVLEEATKDMRWPVSDPMLAAEWDGRSYGSYADNERMVLLFSIAAAHWQPELQQMRAACPENAREGSRATECRRLFGVMADSSSPLIARLGTREMLASSTTPAAQAQWSARLRELDWVMQQATSLLASDESDAVKATPLEYARWVAAKGELPAMRQLLAVHGVAPQPRADWLPAEPQR